MTETIRKQVLAVRATGETNMLDTRRVQVISWVAVSGQVTSPFRLTV